VLVPVSGTTLGGGDGLRLHVKAQQIFSQKDDVVNSMKKKVGGAMGGAMSFLGSGTAALTLADTSTSSSHSIATNTRAPATPATGGPTEFILGGESTRVDHAIQEALISNSYISALR
jgi:hypothetical protein